MRNKFLKVLLAWKIVKKTVNLMTQVIEDKLNFYTTTPSPPRCLIGTRTNILVKLHVPIDGVLTKTSGMLVIRTAFKFSRIVEMPAGLLASIQPMFLMAI